MADKIANIISFETLVLEASGFNRQYLEGVVHCITWSLYFMYHCNVTLCECPLFVRYTEVILQTQFIVAFKNTGRCDVIYIK